MPSKRIVLVMAAAILLLAGLAPGVAASPRSGDLHVTKECSDYTCEAGLVLHVHVVEHQGDRARRPDRLCPGGRH